MEDSFACLAASPAGGSSGHAVFIWGFTTALYPCLISWVRFTDDAGLHWEIDTSLHLVKLAKRHW